MKRRRAMWLIAVPIGTVALAWIGLGQVSLRALDEPGRMETYVATKAKRILIDRAARQVSRPQPADLSQSLMIGQMQFRGRCASCHGLDGQTPSDIGSAMYPRASDLGSTEVQRWSDAEMFWIIQNGIRLSGMPGFGKSLSDRDIWPLVDYVRSLGRTRMGQATDTGRTAPHGVRETERRWPR